MGVIPRPGAGTTIGAETAGAAFPQRVETSAGTPDWNVIVHLARGHRAAGATGAAAVGYAPPHRLI